MTQAALAKAANVDKTLITRLVHGDRRRTSEGYRRLCNFLQQSGYLGRPQAAYAALDEVWDQSEAHEQALVALILASRDLWPELGKDG